MRWAIQQAIRSFRRQGLRFYFSNTLNILIRCRLQLLISSWAPRQCCRSGPRNTVQLPDKGDGMTALNTNLPPMSVPPLGRCLLWLSRLFASGHKPHLGGGLLDIPGQDYSKLPPPSQYTTFPASRARTS